MKQAEAVAVTLGALETGSFAGRVWRTGVGPCVVAVRKGRLVDITSNLIPTMRDLCERDDIAEVLAQGQGNDIASVSDVLSGKGEVQHCSHPSICRQSKQQGVTFATSMLERVIEEKARGNAALADAIRADITRLIGDDLSKLVPGSPKPWR